MQDVNKAQYYEVRAHHAKALHSWLASNSSECGQCHVIKSDLDSYVKGTSS